MLKEDLGGVQDGTVGGGIDVSRLEPNDLGIVSVSPTALEATYVRLEWEDGRVGRFKLSDTGFIERAVIIGDRGRDKRLEAVFIGGDGRIETLLDRLRQHAIPTSGE
jgi:central kinetochore subunit Mal2/MCM21